MRATEHPTREASELVFLHARTRRRPGFGATLSALLLGAGACTAVLNHQATQCQTDGDCAAFGGHPYCQSGVCVSSGLGPTN